MKIRTILTLSLLFVIASCDSSEKTKESEVDAEKHNSECQLSTMAFELNGKGRTFKFKYQNDQLSNVDVYEQGDGIDEKMAFDYTKDGKLRTFYSGSFIANYMYDDMGNVISISGEKNMNTRDFEYDKKGRIIKQITLFSGKPYTTFTYSYDENNQPVKVEVYDKNQTLLEIDELKYDDKKNPFRNKGALINNLEMFYGYPVGQQEHNVISIKKTYQTKTSYKINGAYRSPGEVELNENKFVYNTEGYPTSVTRLRNGKEVTMHLTYNCD